MNNLVKRNLLFLIGCIGSRLLLTYLAKKISNKNLPILGYIALLPASAFLYIYLTNSRKTGLEVFGSKIWWNNLRPVHSLLYFIFAYLAIKQNKNAWKIALLDVTIGLISFIIQRLTSSL